MNNESSGSCLAAAWLPTHTPMPLELAIRITAALFEQHGLEYGHGTDNALDEACWLLQHALGLDVLQPPDGNQALQPASLRHCNELIERRIRGREPVAYITGEAFFAGLRFRSDPRALVPRSPLAEWILADFHAMVPDDSPSLRLLDLCTGGGCIAIACAMARPQARVDASDVSAEALALAAENVRTHGVVERVRLSRGSLFDPVDGPYDLIVSNPPYVDGRDMRERGAEFRHEPALGLAAGADGLDLVRPILRGAASHLKPGGWLVVEVGNSAEALQIAFPQVPFMWLEFAGGGDGVFALDHRTLMEQAAAFA